MNKNRKLVSLNIEAFIKYVKAYDRSVIGVWNDGSTSKNLGLNL